MLIDLSRRPLDMPLGLEISPQYYLPSDHVAGISFFLVSLGMGT